MQSSTSSLNLSYQTHINGLNLVNALTTTLNTIFSLDSSYLNDLSITDELQNSFKVLIFDDRVFTLLSPLLKLYFLRDHNICHHMNIKEQREPMPDIVALYLITPSQDNFNYIKHDLLNKTFDNFSINIISYETSRDNDDTLLKSFYSQISEYHSNILNISIYPIDISIYHPKVFSLEIKHPYMLLTTPNITNDKYEQYLANVSNGLFSMLYMLKTLPIIKYKTGYFAEELIQKLQSNFNYLFERFPEKKDEYILRKNNSHNLLILLDREVDLPILLHHASSLGSMLHDNCGICRIKNSTVSSFEIDPLNDYIWNNNISEPFYKVGELIYNDYKKFHNEMGYLDNISKHTDMDTLMEDSKQLSESIEHLRDKLIINNVLNQQSSFYTKLNEAASTRNLGQVYEIEDALLRKRNFIGNDIKKKINDVLTKYAHNDDMKRDIYRLCLIYYLVNANTNEVKHTITQYVPNENVLNYLKDKVNQTYNDNKHKQNTQSNKSGGLFTGFKYVMNSFSNLMAVEQPSIAADLVNSLANNKKIDNYNTYNLYKKSVEKETFNYMYNEVIVYVVGGGCLGEFEYIDELLKKSGKNVMYGCDYLYRPTEFVEDLEQLSKIMESK